MPQLALDSQISLQILDVVRVRRLCIRDLQGYDASLLELHSLISLFEGSLGYNTPFSRNYTVICTKPIDYSSGIYRAQICVAFTGPGELEKSCRDDPSVMTLYFVISFLEAVVPAVLAEAVDQGERSAIIGHMRFERQLRSFWWNKY